VKLYAPLAVTYVALVVLANWLASKYLITVPFTHYLAPAGVLCIGAVLVLRDWLWQLRGFWSSVALIFIAGLLSLAAGFIFGYGSLVRVALASLIAFVVSEGIFESLVFAPLRKRHLTLGVAASASVGNLIDSLVFLVIAFPAIWTSLYAGNVVGKFEMIAVGVALTAVRRRVIPIAV
jgi:uncharacterized PurR-regulated membrane protein YhhQ (DUF165 family)